MSREVRGKISQPSGDVIGSLRGITGQSDEASIRKRWNLFFSQDASTSQTQDVLPGSPTATTPLLGSQNRAGDSQTGTGGTELSYGGKLWKSFVDSVCCRKASSIDVDGYSAPVSPSHADAEGLDEQEQAIQRRQADLSRLRARRDLEQHYKASEERDQVPQPGSLHFPRSAGYGSTPRSQSRLTYMEQHYERQQQHDFDNSTEGGYRPSSYGSPSGSRYGLARGEVAHSYRSSDRGEAGRHLRAKRPKSEMEQEIELMWDDYKKALSKGDSVERETDLYKTEASEIVQHVTGFKDACSDLDLAIEKGEKEILSSNRLFKSMKGGDEDIIRSFYDLKPKMEMPSQYSSKRDPLNQEQKERFQTVSDSFKPIKNRLQPSINSILDKSKPIIQCREKQSESQTSLIGHADTLRSSIVSANDENGPLLQRWADRITEALNASSSTQDKLYASPPESAATPDEKRQYIVMQHLSLMRVYKNCAEHQKDRIFIALRDFQVFNCPI